MYERIKMAINSPECKLENILEVITETYIDGYITLEQKRELAELARAKAIPENSYDIQNQFDNIFERLENLEAFHKPEQPIEPSEEYPEYVAPSGAHDAYKIGDKITYKGKKYICKIDKCVWSPEIYPQGWEEVGG